MIGIKSTPNRFVASGTSPDHKLVTQVTTTIAPTWLSAFDLDGVSTPRSLTSRRSVECEGRASLSKQDHGSTFEALPRVAQSAALDSELPGLHRACSSASSVPPRTLLVLVEFLSESSSALSAGVHRQGAAVHSLLHARSDLRPAQAGTGRHKPSQVGLRIREGFDDRRVTHLGRPATTPVAEKR